MNTRYLLYGVLIALVFAAGALCGDLFRAPALAQGDADTNVTEPIALEPAPVVAAVPYQTETKFDMDPFEPNRVRSTQTAVKTLVLIRSDGGTEIVKAK